VFEEVHTTGERLRQPVLPPGEFSNQLEGKTKNIGYTVIVIDRLNTRTGDMLRAAMAC
jgi:hypothetical protein